MNESPRLSWGAKLGYASGDFGLNLFYTFCTLFLLYYYTDVLGLSPTLAGVVIMAALLFEAVLDPLMGYIANRTRSRFGRYRPYLLYASAPLALSFVAMFVPTGLSGAALGAFALVTHLIFRAMYTVVGIPYASLSAEMTQDSRERSQIAGLRMIFATACALTMATATLPLSSWLGGGQRGFFGLSIIYGGLAIPILILCFARTRETSAQNREAPAAGEIFGMLRANWPLQILLAATVLALISSTMSSKTLLYYLKYDVGSEGALTFALMIMTGSAALSIPFWLFITSRTSKRTAWLMGSATTVANAMAFYAVAPRAGAVLWAMLAINGFANGALSLSFWAMVPDTVEYGEWKSGVRAEGAIYGLISLTQKLALGFGIGMLGVLLDLIGYRPNLGQSDATLHGMRVLLTLAPAGVSTLVATLIWFYPLDHNLHRRLTRAIALRRRRARASGVA